MQAYQTGTYVAAGSWCKILSQPEVINTPPHGICPSRPNNTKSASGPAAGGPYTIEAGLGNVNGKVYLRARFAVQSIIPRHKSSDYRASWDPPTQTFYVTERFSNVCRSNFPKIPPPSVISTSNISMSNFPKTLSSSVISTSHVDRSHIPQIPSPPSAVTPESKSTNPSRVEADMTQAVNISKMDGSSSLTSIRNQPSPMFTSTSTFTPTSTFTSTSTSTNWADMVDEELEEIAYIAQSLNISTSTSDSEESRSDGSSSPTSIHSPSTSTSTSWADMVDEELEEITQTAQSLNISTSTSDSEDSKLSTSTSTSWADMVDEELEEISTTAPDMMQEELGEITTTAPDVQTLRMQTADNLWGAAIHMLDYEKEPEKVHHFNFVNAPVMYKSATSPAVSMWAIKTAGLIDKPHTITLDLKYVLASQAGKYIDPVSFDGPEEELDRLSKLKGSAFRDAVTGRTCKVYHPAGSWMYDRYDPDDDVPLPLHHVDFWSGVSNNVNMPVPVWPMSDLENADMEFIARASDEARPQEGKSNRPVKARGKKSNLHHVQSISDGEDEHQSQQEVVEERSDTNSTSQTLPLPHSSTPLSSTSELSELSLDNGTNEDEENDASSCGGGDDEVQEVVEERGDANDNEEEERVEEIGGEEAAAEVAPSEETPTHRHFHPYDVDNYPEFQPSLLDYFLGNLACPVGRKALELMSGWG